MACPHSSAPGSSPLACSLCIGEKPRIVTTDEVTGNILADGAPVVDSTGAPRKFQPGAVRHHGAPARRRGRPPKKLVEQRQRAVDPADADDPDPEN